MILLETIENEMKAATSFCHSYAMLLFWSFDLYLFFVT